MLSLISFNWVSLYIESTLFLFFKLILSLVNELPSFKCFPLAPISVSFAMYLRIVSSKLSIYSRFNTRDAKLVCSRFFLLIILSYKRTLFNSED